MLNLMFVSAVALDLCGGKCGGPQVGLKQEHWWEKGPWAGTGKTSTGTVERPAAPSWGAKVVCALPCKMWNFGELLVRT